MYNTVSFPGLGLEFQIAKYAFFIGDYGVTWTWIFLLLGLLAGALVFVGMAKKHRLEKGSLPVAALSALIGLIGARAAGVLIGNAESMYYSSYHYYNSVGTVLDFGDGRTPLYFGIVFALIGAAVLCRITKGKVRFASLCDTGVFALAVGIPVGRIGHLFTQSYFGDPTRTALLRMGGNVIDENIELIRESAIGQGANPFDLKYIVGLPVHPVFLYEMAACLVIFALLFPIHKKAYFRGETLIAFLALYGGCRAVFEWMRLDNQVYGLLLPYQLVGAFCLVAGIIAWIVLRWQAVEGNLGKISLYQDKVTDDGFGNRSVARKTRVYTAGDAPENDAGSGDGFGDLSASAPRTYTHEDSGAAGSSDSDHAQ